MDWAGLFWLFSIRSWFCINFSGSSFPGGNKKHCSPLRLGVVVPCHGEGSGITLPSQCTQPLGRSPSVWCSGKPDIKLASGTHGIIVPTGMSDNEVVGSKGSENLKWVNFCTSRKNEFQNLILLPPSDQTLMITYHLSVKICKTLHLPFYHSLIYRSDTNTKLLLAESNLFND